MILKHVYHFDKWLPLKQKISFKQRIVSLFSTRISLMALEQTFYNSPGRIEYIKLRSWPKGFGTLPFSFLFLVGNLRVRENSQLQTCLCQGLLPFPEEIKVESYTLCKMFLKVFDLYHRRLSRGRGVI